MKQSTESKPAKRPLRRWLGDVLLILVVFIAIHWWQTRPLASGPAPPLSGWSAQGARLDIEQFRGQPVLVYFWATWCPICRAEQGGMRSIAEDYPVISVAMQSGDAAEVREYLREHRLDYPAIPDPRGETASLWGVDSVPTSFIVGPDGEIRHSTVGFTTESGLRARLWAARTFH